MSRGHRPAPTRRSATQSSCAWSSSVIRSPALAGAGCPLLLSSPSAAFRSSDQIKMAFMNDIISWDSYGLVEIIIAILCIAFGCLGMFFVFNVWKMLCGLIHGDEIAAMRAAEIQMIQQAIRAAIENAEMHEEPTN
ncbi:hypothetical protein QR680_000517 [Steinernema hermaphroditum]|uniref:Uncharacterized protein n=1 Tax=Steinernema hermaphroditum TaxID=289476 RepID=A0AA39GV15_9BILA|nr:hypothetical protein QR680_000517 [Steinernema hermaphroditum]